MGYNPSLYYLAHGIFYQIVDKVALWKLREFSQLFFIFLQNISGLRQLIICHCPYANYRLVLGIKYDNPYTIKLIKLIFLEPFILGHSNSVLMQMVVWMAILLWENTIRNSQ